MRQKTAFIHAVMHDPDAVFSGSIHRRAGPGCWECPVSADRRSHRPGSTVFLSAHMLPVVEHIPTEVGISYDDKLLARGTPDGLTRRGKGEGGEADLVDAFLDLTDGRCAVLE